MTGPVPVLRPHASQAFDNDLDADRPMDQDELLDYADQGPLPSPTAIAVPGPLAQFLSNMPDFMEGIEKVCRGPLILFLFLHQAHHQMASASTKRFG